MAFLILGAGYAGARVARLLASGGEQVHATVRDPARLQIPGVIVHRLDASDPDSLQALAAALPDRLSVLHSIPPAESGDPTAAILEALGPKIRRLVYLSSTGVYGGAEVVDETTPPAPATAQTLARREAEARVAGGSWSWMVLRPAAIYGPGRGVQVSMATGRYRLAGEGDNFVSRIHVDDLAAVAAAALRSEVEGAFPVADEEPARAREVAAFCARLLGLPMPPSAQPETLHETLRSSRRVDGRAIRERLGVKLIHPSYRDGIPASL